MNFLRSLRCWLKNGGHVFEWRKSFLKRVGGKVELIGTCIKCSAETKRIGK